MPVATPTPAQAPSFPPAPLIVRGNPSTGYVALTFDAGGRDEGLTLSVLDTLKNEGIPATFFLTGEWSRHNQSLVQRMIEDGHELANHTDSHPDLTTLDEASIVAEIVKTEQTIEAITGMPIARMMRPPFGAYNQSVLSAMGKLEYEVIYWTLDSGDWRPERTVEDIVTTVTSQVQPGDIVVMHCYPAKTAKALPHIVEGLHARGLKMGTVTQTRGLGD